MRQEMLKLVRDASELLPTQTNSEDSSQYEAAFN
jgi:hypothetical protein